MVEIPRTFQAIIPGKSKVYVKDYKNIDNLKAAITAAFQEIPREMINSTMCKKRIENDHLVSEPPC